MRSTRFAHFCTALHPTIRLHFVKHFRNFAALLKFILKIVLFFVFFNSGPKFTNFDENASEFQQVARKRSDISSRLYKTVFILIGMNLLGQFLINAIDLCLQFNSLISKISIAPWITGQQDDLQTTIRSRAQHLLHDLYPFRIRVSKGVIKHQR